MPRTWLGTGTRTGSGAHPPQWSPRLDDPPARAGGGGREGRGRGTRARLGYTHDMYARCSRGAAVIQNRCSGMQQDAAEIQDRCNGVQRGVPTQSSSVCPTERIARQCNVDHYEGGHKLQLQAEGWIAHAPYRPRQGRGASKGRSPDSHTARTSKEYAFSWARTRA